jgi:hypothetical protein
MISHQVKPSPLPDEATTRLWRRLRYLRLLVMNRRAVVLIPTNEFNLFVERCLADGWQRGRMYRGFDAWIDYGRVDLRKNGKLVRFEWDNWDEGSMEGRMDALLACLGDGCRLPGRVTKYRDAF